jgi:hypothetical protein
MSMNATFVQVDAAELAKLQAEPSMAEALFQDGPLIPPAFMALSEKMQERVRAAGPNLLADVLKRMDPSIRSQLEARLGRPTSAFAAGQGGDDILKLMQERGSRAAQASAMSTAERTVLELEKAWHGVHYLMCGLTEPGAALLSQPVLGGVPLGEDDEGFSGYGPARYFTPKQVAEISQAMSRPDLEQEAAARFDPAKMSQLKIYPGWHLPEGKSDAKSDLKWLMDSFRRLRDFYSDAAAKNQAIVTCLV